MTPELESIFGPNSTWIPQGYCYLWRPELVALNGVSNGLIGITFFAMTLMLYVLVRRVRIRLNSIVLIFGIFLGASAVTHFLDAWTIWYSDYWIAGILKGMTALASITAAAWLVPLLPKITNLTEIAKLSEPPRKPHLEGSEVLMSALLESMSESIVACDAEGRLVLFNRAARALHGKAEDMVLPPEEWAKQYDLYHPDGKTLFQPQEIPLKRAFNGERFENVEMVIKPAGLPERRILVRGTPLFDSKGQKLGAVVVQTDITERCHAEVERAQHMIETEHLKAERKGREQFISALTHDLRNPLSAAKSGIQTVRRYPERIEKHEPLLKLIEGSLKRADQMIEDLLDATRAEAGQKFFLNIEKMDLAAATREVLEELSLVFGDRFVLKAPEKVIGYWCASSTRRVIQNLASNAIKYGDHSKPVTVTISQDTETELEVHNFGRAVPPEEQENLFKAFHRSANAFESGQKGWGIGLTVVKAIVEAQGGAVRVKSTPGEGTTFSVILPNDSKEKADQH